MSQEKDIIAEKVGAEDTELAKQTRGILDDYYETVFKVAKETDEEMYKELCAGYNDLITELSTMTAEQLKELQNSLKDDPELRFHTDYFSVTKNKFF